MPQFIIIFIAFLLSGWLRLCSLLQVLKCISQNWVYFLQTLHTVIFSISTQQLISNALKSPKQMNLFCHNLTNIHTYQDTEHYKIFFNRNQEPFVKQ